MTVDFVFQLVNYVIAKNLGQGNLNPSDFNVVATLSQLEYANHLLGDYQYVQGKPVSKLNYGMNESTRQRLTPFIAAPTPLTIDATGFSPYPANFIQVDAMYDPTMKRVKYVPQQKLYSYLKSTIDPIATNPIYLIEENGFRFYPNTNHDNVAFPAANVSFVSNPPPIIWAGTPNSDGILIYNQSASSDPLWGDVDMADIIARILRKCGVNLQNEDVNRYAVELEQEGQ